MSRIDGYKHKLLGLITCNSDFNFVYYSQTRKIAIYKLLEDIPVDEDNFDGKKGDILVGGGSGEAPALRISYPKAFDFFTQEDFFDFYDFDKRDEIFKSFWTPTESFMLGNGFLKSGWDPEEKDLENWLTEAIVNMLGNHIPEYSEYKDLTAPNILEFEIIKE